MQISYHGFDVKICWKYSRENKWIKIPDEVTEQELSFQYETPEKDGMYWCTMNQDQEKDIFLYQMGMKASYKTQFRMELQLIDEEDIFHVIPCNIYGDNNAREAHTDEFPLLTFEHNEEVFCSNRWEYRADRSATPISAVCCKKGCVGVAVNPYSSSKEGELHNGLFAELPSICGCSLGYTNDPITFTNKRTPEESTYEASCEAKTEGRIYLIKADESTPARTSIHRMIRGEYQHIHQRASYHKNFQEAVRGCFDSFMKISWNPDTKEYTNCNCLPPENTVLRPWRDVVEIGWTGGGVLAYPLVLAETILGAEGKEAMKKTRSGYEMINRIVSVYNEKSGLINDLTAPINGKPSMVNGWWSEFGLTKDGHCAYNVGSAVHYILKTIDFLNQQKKEYPSAWLDTCIKVIDTVISLQRDDGAFGYTYDIHEKKVLDWEGFAGCWFVPCAAYLYHMTKEEKYLLAAKKALSYYEIQVINICCSGTPMDTWKSVDEEGNLAFIRGARLLHEYTGEDRFLKSLKHGADYEFLWRYAYQAHPDHKPLLHGWNSCGGSVTSVSNPHIHPMGMIVDTDLYYLGKTLGDEYYTQRAEDGTAWIMQTLELYPGETGYGAYGVLSERWCPSDGLTVQRDSNGDPYSSWYSYNLWAAAAAFEEVCERELKVD